MRYVHQTLVLTILLIKIFVEWDVLDHVSFQLEEFHQFVPRLNLWLEFVALSAIVIEIRLNLYIRSSQLMKTARFIFSQFEPKL